MPSHLEMQLPLAAGIGTVLAVWLAERLHERRCRVVARLAVGPSGQPRRWVRLVRPVKAAALGVMAWALTTLLMTGGGGYGARGDADERREKRPHVVFAADLSPSMNLTDAGPDGKQSRLARMAEVVDGLLQRLDPNCTLTVIGFYTDAMPVVVDTDDPELVRNIFAGLPISLAMEAGKTDLGAGVRKTMEHLTDYPPQSATLFICTDGDTVDLGAIPKPPPSVRETFVLGAGDVHRGTFIDGHVSRQEPAVLEALAGRLRGRYLNVNDKQVPTPALGTLAVGAGASKARWDWVDWAIFAFAAAAAVHAAIPVLLEYFGSDWKPVRIERRGARET